MEYGMDGGVVSQNFILFLTKICEKDISMKYGGTSFDTTKSEHGYNEWLNGVYYLKLIIPCE